MKQVGSRNPNKFETEILYDGRMEISFYENIMPQLKLAMDETTCTLNEIEAMTKPDLITFAEQEGIKINPSKSKVVILESIIVALCDYSYDKYTVCKEADETIVSKIQENYDIWLSFARELDVKRATEKTLAYRDNLLKKVEWSLGTGIYLTDESRIAVTSFCSELNSITNHRDFPYIENWPDYPVIDVIPSTSYSLKLSEVSKACEIAIHNGIDLTIGNETYHFSLKPEDQINISSAFKAIENGAIAFPYHNDGGLCRLYNADEIIALGQAATQHILYHTTYCNHLNYWIKRTEIESELSKIYYGVELPDDLAVNMTAIIEQMSGAES